MEANFANLPERCGGCECTCEYLRHADKQLGASVGGLWFWLNTRPFAHRAVRFDATLNRMIAGTAREYLEFVIAAAVGARAPPDYPHTFAAMLTDWIANPLLIQHDTNAPQLTNTVHACRHCFQPAFRCRRGYCLQAGLRARMRGYCVEATRLTLSRRSG